MSASTWSRRNSKKVTGATKNVMPVMFCGIDCFPACLLMYPGRYFGTRYGKMLIQRRAYSVPGSVYHTYYACRNAADNRTGRDIPGYYRSRRDYRIVAYRHAGKNR